MEITKLQKITNALKNGPGYSRYDSFGANRDFPDDHHVYFFVAPELGEFNPAILNSFMKSLVPDLKPLDSEDFRFENTGLLKMVHKLHCGSLLFKEELGSYITTHELQIPNPDYRIKWAFNLAQGERVTSKINLETYIEILGFPHKLAAELEQAKISLATVRGKMNVIKREYSDREFESLRKTEKLSLVPSHEPGSF